MSTGKFSIDQQIEEVLRELDLRRHVYPGQVSKGRMRQSIADFHMARLEAALRTLIWVRDHQAEIVTVAANAAAAKDRQQSGSTSA